MSLRSALTFCGCWTDRWNVPSHHIPELGTWRGTRFDNMELFSFKIHLNLPPILSILVPFWFTITSLMFCYLCKLLLDLIDFKGNDVLHKYDFTNRDVGTLNSSLRAHARTKRSGGQKCWETSLLPVCFTNVCLHEARYAENQAVWIYDVSYSRPVLYQLIAVGSTALIFLSYRLLKKVF